MPSIEPYSGSVWFVDLFLSAQAFGVVAEIVLFLEYHDKMLRNSENGKFPILRKIRHKHKHRERLMLHCLQCISMVFYLFLALFVQCLCTQYLQSECCIQIKIDFCFVLCKWIWFCRLVTFYLCAPENHLLSPHFEIWSNLDKCSNSVSGMDIVYFWLDSTLKSHAIHT